MLVNKRCTYCGEKFQAKTTKTKYCSLSCNQKHYKHKAKKTRQVLAKNSEITERHPFSERLELVKVKEFLSVTDCGILLNVSRSTIKRLILSGDLLSFKIRGRVLVSRKDLDHLCRQGFNKPNDKKVEIKKKEFDEKKYYFMGEISEYYKISLRSIERHLKLKGIEKIKKGRFTYVLKRDIRKLYGAPNKRS
ncbi:helix-turn-helix domain-containing protein [Algibacter miyuki]|uniref:Helix-turn-helix domain-containing protein n=1 Tax=Algibacter miyuki TaxID=1306933 RepID=A0ABV5GZJ5_9FLAO|nr:helix-turn-helix domain-containing protein [Algibacter miyuki]MDN3666907.1 helix-turn-helix domain-containing protein [Algibacter miyuki]